MNRKKRQLLGIFSCLLLAGLSGCGDGRIPLVLYSPHGRDLLNLVEESFESLHPEVDVGWLDMGSQEVLRSHPLGAGQRQADVWFGGPATILYRGAANDLLEPYRPAWGPCRAAREHRVFRCSSFEQDSEAGETVPALLAELERQGVGLATLATHHATLEDVFVHHTGRALRDD